MKAGIYVTGSGPLLLLTSYDTLTEPKLIEKLHAKGIKKSIVYEVPVESVKQHYGNHFDVVLEDLKQEDDLRVMDYDGHRIFNMFSFNEFGEPAFSE